MKKLVVFLFALFLLQVHTYGQQAIFQGAPQIVSPEIHSDGSVTFRFQAPNAGEVRLTGDFLPTAGWMPGSVTMEKNAAGVWSYTTRPLSSDLYGYAFIVDGLRSMDPNNVYMIRDVASVTNVFIVPGGQGDYYSVNKVPHGTVLRTWYDSPSDQYEQKRRITIYTPQGYENGKDKYPVFYLLHGMGGDEEAWINLGRTSQILDNLIASGKAKPMIVVMSNGNVIQEAAPGESSLGLYKPGMQLDGTMDGQFEVAFKDVIKFVESRFRVIPRKSDRAVAGLSMARIAQPTADVVFPVNPLTIFTKKSGKCSVAAILNRSQIIPV